MSGLPAWRVFNDAEVPCSPLMLRGDEWCRASGGGELPGPRHRLPGSEDLVFVPVQKAL